MEQFPGSMKKIVLTSEHTAELQRMREFMEQGLASDADQPPSAKGAFHPSLGQRPRNMAIPDAEG
jgi:hypothetical protein